MSSIEFYLTALPAGYRERALTNFQSQSESFKSKKEVSSAWRALEYAFDWGETPEGQDFWMGLAIWLEYGGNKPALPVEDSDTASALRGSPCYYRVLRINGGTARVEPRFFSLETAKVEALRLSGQHQGESFEIVKCLGTARCVKLSVFWNDGINPDEE
jgi:hypothetical protein